MGFEFFLNNLDNPDQLWRYYWMMAITVWVLAWLGIRRWMWWGLSLPLLGLVAGLAFTTGLTETGKSAPMAMLVALAFLNNPNELPIEDIKAILFTTLMVTGGLVALQLLFGRRKQRRPQTDEDNEEKQKLFNRIDSFKEELDD